MRSTTWASTPSTPTGRRCRSAYAAQVTRLDSDVGRLLALLKELQLDEKTLVLFGRATTARRFRRISELGVVRRRPMACAATNAQLYEGGLAAGGDGRAGRAWCPPGRVCDEPWAFWDFLPTAAELAGAKLPAWV